MRVNFKIEDFRDILFDGSRIDLHNNFLFKGFNYDLVNRQVILHWSKGIGDWIPVTEFETVTITHFGVSYFIVLQTSVNLSIDDQRTLSEVSFFPSSEREEMEQCLDKMQPDENDDIIYTFIGEQVLRIGCEDVVLKV
jgi:predicted flavoprotein YhiN